MTDKKESEEKTMTITKINISDDNNITLIIDGTTELPLSADYAVIIKERMMLQELRYAITNILDEEIADGYIDMDKYDGTREEFEDEIYVDLEDEISCGDYTALCNDGKWIREKITDTANYYELEPDETEDADDWEE